MALALTAVAAFTAFDADNVDAIRAAIEHVLQNKARRDELIDKGNQRCKVFSWARCAAETLAVYRAIM